MVNTFLTSSDFEQSARNLDPSHLWKQVLEATQILRLLEDLDTITSWYHLTPIIPTYRGTNTAKIADNFLSRCQWVKTTAATYLKYKTRLVYRLKDERIQLIQLAREDSDKLITIYGKDKYRVDGSTVILTKVRYNEQRERVREEISYPRRNCLIYDLGERVVSLGYWSHPIVRMWAGEQNCLRWYINCHLCEHFAREGSSKMTPFDVTRPIQYPWWTTYKSFHQTHLASLYRKSQVRRSKYRDWYDASKLRGWLPHGYCWTSNLERDLIIRILEGEDLPPDTITVPISADAKPKKSQRKLRQASRFHPYPYEGPYKLDQEGFVIIRLA